MFELQGKYGKAKVFTDVVEQEAISQVIELLNQAYSKDAHVRMMPDIHAGKGCTIGTTMKVQDKVCPNLVGVDISCGMLTCALSDKSIDFAELDKAIRERVPSGFSIHQESLIQSTLVPLDKLYCKDHVDLERAKRSVGTLGGGNHFVEIDKNSEGNLYLIVHSGSRNLGKQVAEYYQREAIKSCRTVKVTEEEIQEIVKEMKRQGRQAEIEGRIKTLRSANSTETVVKDLAYLSGEMFDNYIHDMRILEEYARINRLTMAGEIADAINLDIVDTFTTVHNYIDTDNMILRKGSVSAQEGEILLIPINMRDGSLLCRGKGNEDWNFSAPHGAGRLMSRGAAKREFSVQEFRESMQGIFTTSVGQSTLDECPMAYKNMDDIVDNIGPTAEILEVLKPVYNFKAGD